MTTEGRSVHCEKTDSSMPPHMDEKPPTGTAICRGGRLAIRFSYEDTLVRISWRGDAAEVIA